ncbi:MAG: hypothetical protein P1V20_15965 [Verrucomicrobiales bacterium]|nr:hypothetical protein [Verrucomicrobiales bacterium]
MNLSKEQLSHYITGSLLCSGIVYNDHDLIRAMGLYRQILGNGHYHLPFFLIVDLMLLLEKGYEVQFRSEKDRGLIEENEHRDRKLIMRYERECLGRILQSAEINTAMEIAATSPNPAKVTARLLLQVLTILAPHYPDEHQINPGLLRDYLFPENTRPEDYSAGDFETLLEEFLGEINANVNWGNILFEEDLFELTHLEALATDHLRVGCRQILEVSRLLHDPVPNQLDLTTHEDGADTAFLDETHYPTGGLAGLTNRGSFENLLTSELVYLDEGTKDVSLFELRYAEGELLYYLRDSGNLRRKRRTIHFVLDVGEIFENKLPGYNWQYSVLLQGLCLRLLHDLFEIFEMDALRFHFHYIESPQASLDELDFFNGEIGVMKTVLADYTRHGWVTFETKETIELNHFIDPKRKSYSIIFSSSATHGNWKKSIARADREELAIHNALIAVNKKVSDGLCLPSTGLTMPEISELKNGILEKLVS